MAWDVEVTVEFEVWWNGLDEAEQVSVDRGVLLLEDRGPDLPGGDKTGDDRWYEANVPLADRLYDEHLAGIEEGDDGQNNEVR